MRDAFAHQGYATSALIHDAVLLRRFQPLGPWRWGEQGDVVPDDVRLDPSLLRDVEREVERATGIAMKLREESLRPLEGELQELISAPRAVRTSHQAAQEAYLHKARFIRHSKEGIAMFDSENNTWSMNPIELVSVIMPRLLHEIQFRFTSEGAKSKHFLHDVKSRADMFAMLRAVVPRQELWKEDSMRGGRGYLAFRNGYWDFQQGAFFDGSYPEMHLLVGVRDTYRQATEEEEKTAHDFLAAPYTDRAVFDFYLKSVARALYGDVTAKQGYFVIGPTGSGKSSVTGALKAAFASVAMPFDSSNLCNAAGESDQGRRMAWLIELEYCRLAIGNEINLNGEKGKKLRLNAILWKMLISGGEVGGSEVVNWLGVKFCNSDWSRPGQQVPIPSCAPPSFFFVAQDSVGLRRHYKENELINIGFTFIVQVGMV